MKLIALASVVVGVFGGSASSACVTAPAWVNGQPSSNVNTAWNNAKTAYSNAVTACATGTAEQIKACKCTAKIAGKTLWGALKGAFDTFRGSCKRTCSNGSSSGASSQPAALRTQYDAFCALQAAKETACPTPDCPKKSTNLVAGQVTTTPAAAATEECKCSAGFGSTETTKICKVGDVCQTALSTSCCVSSADNAKLLKVNDENNPCGKDCKNSMTCALSLLPVGINAMSQCSDKCGIEAAKCTADIYKAAGGDVGEIGDCMLGQLSASLRASPLIAAIAGALAYLAL